MPNVALFTLTSVFAVSLISFIGILTLTMKEKGLKKFLLFMVSFSAGTLFGDAFIHLLPEAAESSGFTLSLSLALLAGIVVSFAIEKVIHWRHCHLPITKTHIHPFSYMSLAGDAVHNFLDGIIIAAGYLAGLQTGIATTVAVILHEIPQEIGDIGVLLHGGFTRGKALLMNFITALTAFLGAGVALALTKTVEAIQPLIIAFAAGGFIYIAGSDLIPELHKELAAGKSFGQILFFLLGVGIMVGLLFLEL
ncbi:ZIP family metal transporter [Candidatus Woesearchaeota archaeon]|nr:ZIP family metal transporter [Candidatus Woesearchaeota archaeon]